jgi:hypothetical protein
VKPYLKKRQLNSEKGKDEVEILKIKRGSFSKGSFRISNKS